MPLQSVQVYNLFRSKNFSDEEAELVAAAIDHKENLATKGDIAEVKAELKEDISRIREDMVKMESSMIKWFMGTAFAMTGLLSGIVFAMLKFVH